jgi:adenylate kinase family enzyme
MMGVMKRIVVLGRGASGKSVFSRDLSRATGIPCTELDRVFWSSDLQPKSPAEWQRLQTELAQTETWILDGDLGPYDAPEVRLARADAVVLFDLNLAVCAWRALRRSRQRLDFWLWLVTWRLRYRPALLRAIESSAPGAQVFVVRNRGDGERMLERIARRILE